MKRRADDRGRQGVYVPQGRRPDKEAWDAAAALSTHETRFGELRNDLDGTKRDLTAEIDGLRRDFDRRFDDLDRRIGLIEREVGEVKRELAELRAELRMHRWVLGFIVALNVGIMLRLFTM